MENNILIISNEIDKWDKIRIIMKLINTYQSVSNRWIGHYSFTGIIKISILLLKLLDFLVCCFVSLVSLFVWIFPVLFSFFFSLSSLLLFFLFDPFIHNFLSISVFFYSLLVHSINHNSNKQQSFSRLSIQSSEQ